MAGLNGYIGQINGPFTANVELMPFIQEEANKTVNYLLKLGIQTEVRNEVIINGKTFEIGKTGILEFDKGVEITSIVFSQDVDSRTIIDFTFK